MVEMLKPHRITKEQYEQLRAKGLEKHLAIMPYNGTVVVIVTGKQIGRAHV